MKTLYTYAGVVKRVIDGDTVLILIDLGFSIFTEIRFRLYGIDTPEITSKDTALRDIAIKAKRYVVDTIEGKPVMIQSLGKDKYGRYLSTIWVDSNTVSVNQQLINLGLAKAYFGDGKTSSVWVG